MRLRRLPAGLGHALHVAHGALLFIGELARGSTGIPDAPIHLIAKDAGASGGSRHVAMIALLLAGQSLQIGRGRADRVWRRDPRR
jgi:hypothetical protein